MAGTLTLTVTVDGTEETRTGYDELIYAIGRSAEETRHFSSVKSVVFRSILG